MKKILVILVLAVIVLSWNFIFSSEKKLDLTDEAKVLQGLSQAIAYKLAVRQYWQEKGALPTAQDWQQFNHQVDVDISKSLVDRIGVGEEAAGAISVYFVNKPHIQVAANINGSKIVLKPIIINDKFDWVCSGTLEAALLPKPCQKQ